MYVYASYCINHKGARHGAVGGAGVFGRTGHIGDRALAARAIRRRGRVLRGRRGAGRRRARGPGGESQTLRRGGCVIEDLREEFVRDFVFPTLRAGAVYARTYLLGTSMARPAI